MRLPPVPGIWASLVMPHFWIASQEMEKRRQWCGPPSCGSGGVCRGITVTQSSVRLRASNGFGRQEFKTPGLAKLIYTPAIREDEPPLKKFLQQNLHWLYQFLIHEKHVCYPATTASLQDHPFHAARMWALRAGEAVSFSSLG